jgi:hypothetical protein
LTSGYHLSFTVGAALVVAATVGVMTVLSSQVALAGVEEATGGGVAQPELAYVWEEVAQAQARGPRGFCPHSCA